MHCAMWTEGMTHSEINSNKLEDTILVQRELCWEENDSMYSLLRLALHYAGEIG